jgi:hypothetical protein
MAMAGLSKPSPLWDCGIAVGSGVAEALPNGKISVIALSPRRSTMRASYWAWPPCST